MFTLWKECLPPSVIEHAVSAHIATNHDTLPNLIVARDSLLQIYRVIEEEVLDVVENQGEDPDEQAAADINEESGGAFIKLTAKNIRKNARLELVFESRLHGNIASMAVIRTTSSSKYGRDALLLGFKDAKMSLLEWCTVTNTLITVSIHHYEDDNYRREFLNNPNELEICVEPSFRCAILPIYNTHLAILPFRQENQLLDTSEGSNKWPYVPSMVIPFHEISSEIKNVLSVRFLNNFYEPTIAILYEPIETWTGRLQARKDTCELVVVSLDLTNRKFPIIYRRDHLPYDCHTLLPVPAPLGGLLIISNNCIIYVDQGSPGIGIAVNARATTSTDFHLRTDQAHLGITLDASNYIFLTPQRLLITLAGGELFLAELIRDGRSIANIRLGKVGASIIASCVCKLGDHYFFLGSRVADSLLIQYVESRESIEQRTPFTQQARQQMDLDAELYGEDMIEDDVTLDKSFAKLYTFRVCDSLPSIGSITSMTVGRSTVGITEVGEQDETSRLDLVLTSGYGKSGALSILRRTIRPVDVSEVELQDVREMWTIRCRKERTFGGVTCTDYSVDDPEDIFHRFLIISGDESTLILETGDELQELEKSDFFTAGRTIAVGSVLDDTRIVQVDPFNVRLLNTDAQLIQHVPFDDGTSRFRIDMACITDPYVLLISNVGRFSILQANPQTRELSVCHPLSLSRDRRVVCGCICVDRGGKFVRVEDARRDHAFGMRRDTSMPMDDGVVMDQQEGMDDIDMELYGATEKEEMDEKIMETTSHAPSTKINPSTNMMDTPNVTFWCMLYAEDGTLEIYHLPSMELVFSSPRFDLLPTVVADGVFTEGPTTAWPDEDSNIREVISVNFGREGHDLHIMAMSASHELAVYQPFLYVPDTALSMSEDAAFEGDRRLALRFRRLTIDRAPSAPPPAAAPGTDESIATAMMHHAGMRQRHMIPFAKIGGQSGVFITGTDPAWLIYTSHRCLRLHPMETMNVSAFTPFHNVHCPHGFLFYERESLHISQLPIGFNYDLHWPLRKIQLGKSAHHIVYHPSSETYVVATATWKEFILKDDPTGVREHRAPGETLPIVNACALELFTPITWESIDRYEFEENERVLSMKCITLATAQTSSGHSQFIAVGTGYVWGEDVSAKGRIYIFDIMEVVPEPGRPQTNHKLKLRCREEVKGVVSVVDGIRGHLLTAIGRQIILQDFEDTERLNGIAFLDAQVYLTSVACIKNMFLIGDLCKSIWFVAFQEEPPKVALLGKDTSPLAVTCNEFLINGSTMYFAVADAEGGMHLFSYSPHNVQSFGGQKLIRRGDISIGSPVRKMLRLPRFSPDGHAEQQLCICALANGALGILTPVPDQAYKRMQLLSARLINGIQHLAGLNPKAYRSIALKYRLAFNPVRAILDGDLLSYFLHLSVARRREMAAQARNREQQLLDDLAYTLRWPREVF